MYEQLGSTTYYAQRKTKTGNVSSMEGMDIGTRVLKKSQAIPVTGRL
jgi:hypothetical protein